MENSDYEGAIQLFERARAQMLHHPSQPLLLVSLVSFVTVMLHRIEISHPLFQISGWKFDDLSITIQQRVCEALYASGRTNEGGESLLKIVNTFDEEVYMNGSITKWVSGESVSHQSHCCASEAPPQILSADISPLPKARVMQPRRQPDAKKR